MATDTAVNLLASAASSTAAVIGSSYPFYYAAFGIALAAFALILLVMTWKYIIKGIKNSVK